MTNMLEDGETFESWIRLEEADVFVLVEDDEEGRANLLRFSFLPCGVERDRERVFFQRRWERMDGNHVR